ncbi:unnamed protein product, partial [Timema podura]|nr:unnamed protein product [Timema podura]
MLGVTTFPNNVFNCCLLSIVTISHLGESVVKEKHFLQPMSCYVVHKSLARLQVFEPQTFLYTRKHVEGLPTMFAPYPIDLPLFLQGVRLGVARTLVTPGNPAQVTSSSQKSMRQCGLLEALCDILMASGVPADILTETISTVGEVIRGNQSNQEYFSTVMAPSTPPRPALVVLLMSMVNEKQPFILRCSVLYCYQCFLFKNEVGQSQLVQTLLPSATEG